MPALDDRVQRSQAVKAFERGDFRRAYGLGTAILRKSGRDLALRELVGLAAAQLGLGARAEEHLRKVLKHHPDRSHLHVALGDACLIQGKRDDALAHYERMLTAEPQSRRALAGKATVLEQRGAHDDARALLQPIVDAGADDAQVAAVWSTIEQAQGRFAESVGVVEKHLASAATDLNTRRHLCKLAAKAYEKTDRHDQAFEAFATSNRVIARPFDPDAYVERIDELIATFSKQNLDVLPRASDPSSRPVFIACMPRSGSTLCEQIIHAHPQGFGAGEITEIDELISGLPTRLMSLQRYPACLGDLEQDHVDAMGRWYGERLNAYDRRAKRVVNKHLDNDLHLGLIALIAPGARVIHCRRDPMDNGLSIFMAAMNPETYPWATDLANIGLAYRQHERLMGHWRDALDLEILDVPYEEVVADPETLIRRIIEFCDLPWDERCLAFHEADREVKTLSYDQVRRPIYRSAVRRYERYAAHLGPLRAALDGD